MMASYLTTARIDGAPVSGKDILPEPVAGRLGRLAVERTGEPDLAVPGADILVVEQANVPEVVLERNQKAFGEHGHAILGALAIVHENLTLREIKILDP